jgi:predicted cupin superfamily sugar epimerase
MPPSASEIIRALGLARHPEGGYFRETFRAETLPVELPNRGARAASTAIYFLLERGDFSAFHRVRSDEVWHHYFGAPLELHLLGEGTSDELVLGPDLGRNQRPQVVVRAHVLQAARLVPRERDATSEDFSLVGCTVAPGFDFADFEMPKRVALVAEFPDQRALIEALTRE